MTRRNRTKPHYLLAWLCACALGIAAWAAVSSAPTAHSCEAEYDAAGLAIATGATNRGDREKLRTKLDHAWRAFWREKRLDIANQSLDTLSQLLGGAPTAGISPENRTLIAEQVAAFRSCINGQPPAGTATVSVAVFDYDETVAGGKGAPAGSGVYLFVDGRNIASTDDNGRAVLTVPAGTVALQAIRPSTSIAQTQLQAAAGSAQSIELILDDSKEVVSPVQLQVGGLQGSVLPADAQQFGIVLLDNGSPRPATHLTRVVVEDDIGNTLREMTDLFVLDAAGAIQPTSVAAVISAFQSYPGRQLVLRVMAVDALGFTLEGSLPIYFGQHLLNVTLLPPPSAPTLPVAGLQVTYRLMGTGLAITRTTDANGTASFGLVPLGNGELDAQSQAGGRYYYGQADFFLNRATLVQTTLTHTDDLVAGVSRYRLVPLALAAADGDAPGEASDAPERLAAHQAAVGDGIAPQATATLRVGAGAANREISANTTLLIPRGTARALLRYQVTTLEYPVYVNQQSVFNDRWTVTVRTRQSGQQLFDISRNVNAQLTQAPIWRANGSTGYIERNLDVAALTAQADAEITILATATNVADALLPTIVEVELSDDPDRLVIEDIQAEALANTDGDSRSFSIPLQGETNTLGRRFALTISKPQEAVVTRVRVEVLSAAGTLGQVFEEAPGANVEIVNDTTLRVRSTFHAGNTGTVNTVPPPAHGITYKFTVFADLDGQEISDDAISPAMRALWRLQAAWRTDPARRYGQRDNGGDDWLAVRTWDYINRHGALLTRIDDISGEHGRDIGHNSHDVGTDIDLYHVYTFAGATSGSDNYNRLRNAVVRILSLPEEQTADDRAAVNAWIAQSRPRFQTILSTTDTQTIYYAIGSAHTQGTTSLREGWARDLLRNGTVSSTQGATYDSGLGAWAFNPGARMGFDRVHNSHFHIKRPRER
jgi:hypothetical protein